MPRHSERRRTPYRPEQLFDLVADVERYPEFLPWCRKSRIRRREESLLIADLTIGFKGISESFTSRITLNRAAMRIHVTYERGPFRYLRNNWVFSEAEDGCLIDFDVDFAFRSRLLNLLMGAVFTEAVQRMVRAFEARAHTLYGPQSASSPRLRA